LAKERQEQAVEALKRLEIEQRTHLRLARLKAINAQIVKERQAREDARLQQERSQALKQKKDDLTAFFASRAEPTVPAPPAPAVQASTLLTLQQMLPSPSKILATASNLLFGSTTDRRDVKTSSDNASSNSSLPTANAETTSQMPSSSAPPKPLPKLAESLSKKEENMEGASNPWIDTIMGMTRTGLDEVKNKILNIKTKTEPPQDASKAIKTLEKIYQRSS
jgi:hypothetical protein